MISHGRDDEMTSGRHATRQLARRHGESAYADAPDPIIFLARGHSGTRALARILDKAGIYMGTHDDPRNLNETLDSLHWAYRFQSPLTPEHFVWGEGCALRSRVEEQHVRDRAEACRRDHLAAYQGGRWGFKTGGAMFCYELYDLVFPQAKYIYMVRDGRDVTLSHQAFFHLTNPRSRDREWELFKILTFGISNDLETCPFEFPDSPHPDDAVMNHRYWIQAKSWREHARMVASLEARGRLSGRVHLVRYEDLCREPRATLAALFQFLELELDTATIENAVHNLHIAGIGRWQHFGSHVSGTSEDLPEIFDFMRPELEALGYA
jgi:hypothetical protein